MNDSPATHSQTDFLRELLALVERGIPAVAVTVVEEAGHIPQDVGAKAIVTAEGRHWGTVGGGKIEARAITTAQDMLRDRIASPVLLRWDLRQDLNMTCGGTATLLFEPHREESWNVIVFGAGHIAQSLVPILNTLSCRAICVDHRREWIEPLKAYRRVQSIQIPDTEGYLEFVRQAPHGTFYVICTQGHATDLPILEAALRRGDAGYVGVIGSVVKRRSLRAGLLRAGLSEADCEKFQTPMGLPIGTNAPSEIAISIAAKLLEQRDAFTRENRVKRQGTL